MQGPGQTESQAHVIWNPVLAYDVFLVGHNDDLRVLNLVMTYSHLYLKVEIRARLQVGASFFYRLFTQSEPTTTSHLCPVPV